MIQQVILGILFLGAAFYLGRSLYLSFQAKKSCATGCGKCGVIDVDMLSKDIRKNEAFQ